MPDQDDFESRLKAYLSRGAGAQPPGAMEARIVRVGPGGTLSWRMQVVVAAAVVVLAIGLGIGVHQARQSNSVLRIGPTPTPSAHVSPTASAKSTGSSIRMIDAGTGWAAGSQTNRILRTTTGGSHWDDVTPMSARPGFWITYFMDAENAWLGSSLQPDSGSPDFSVNFYRTTDGGHSWRQVGRALPDQGWPAGLDFVDSTHGWLLLKFGAAGDHAALYGTVNGGATWTKLSVAESSPFGCSVLAPVFLTSSTGWVPGGCNPGAGSLLYVTHDGARSWNETTLPMPVGFDGACASCQIEGLGFSDSRNGVFVLDIPYGSSSQTHEFLYVTQDGGGSWGPGTLMPSNSSATDFISATEGWTLDATTNTLFHTSDGGRHWLAVGTIPSSPSSPSSPGVIKVDFVNARVGWALVYGTLGNTVIRTSDGGKSWMTQLAP